MDKIHKELLALASLYADVYNQDLDKSNKTKDPILAELFEFVQLELIFGVCNKKIEIAKALADGVQLKIREIVKDTTDYTIDVLTLILQCSFVLEEDGVFKGSKAMKLKRLNNEVYNQFVKKKGFDTEWRNCVNIISDLITYKAR